jgi:hypothetical protein
MEVEMTFKALQTYSELRDVFTVAYGRLVDARRKAERAEFKSVTELIDTMFVYKRVSEMLDDLRKESNKLIELLEKLTCAIYATQNSEEPIRGVLATGTPDLKMGVTLPTREGDPEGFKKLMEHFGFSDLVVQNNLAGFHWPRLIEYVTILASEGKPLPPGIDPAKQYPLYKVRLTQYCDLDSFLNEARTVVDTMQKQSAAEFKEKSDKFWDEILSTRKRRSRQ